MAKLDIITWLWGKKYTAHDVTRLQFQVRRNLRVDHTFHLFSDRVVAGVPPTIRQHLISDLDLCDRHCFCRLRMFDPEWQKENGFTGHIVSLDLDVVITGTLDSLFKEGQPDFMMLKGVNSVNPNPFNGSIMMLKAGTHANIWSEFSLENAAKIKFHEFPDDQGWIWHMAPDAEGWKGGTRGVYAFQKPGWPGYPTNTMELPSDAKIVVFTGKRKPVNYTGLSWVNRHWLSYT